MCIAAKAGIDASAVEDGDRLDATLFGEAPSRFLVATANPRALLDLAAGHGIPATALGVVGGDRFRLAAVDLDLATVTREWSEGLDRALAPI
jgi:phosphoribosylformylglycinamidine (FGAM) synthase-like enzyme